MLIENLTDKIYSFLKNYLEMDVNGMIINCPYWMNKLENGVVVLRGFANGKGTAMSIRTELINRLHDEPPEFTGSGVIDIIHKFARRERIGIDCSGFVYRVLDELVRLGYRNCHINKLDEVFKDGVNRTNTRTITSLDYCIPIDKVEDIRLGDVIRLRGGSHIAVIIKAENQEIIYAHSSLSSTKIQGVHTSVIRIRDLDKTLEKQHWEEVTRKGENFGKKHFKPQKGDGVFRLLHFVRNDKNTNYE